MLIKLKHTDDFMYTPYSQLHIDLDTGSEEVRDEIFKGVNSDDSYILVFSEDKAEHVVLIKKQVIINTLLTVFSNEFKELKKEVDGNNHITMDYSEESEELLTFLLRHFSTSLVIKYDYESMRYFESLRDFIIHLCLIDKPLNIGAFVESGFKFGTVENGIITYGEDLSLSKDAELVFLTETEEEGKQYEVVIPIEPQGVLVFPYRNKGLKNATKN